MFGLAALFIAILAGPAELEAPADTLYPVVLIDLDAENMARQPIRFDVNAKGDSLLVDFKIHVSRRDGEPLQGTALLLLQREERTVAQCPISGRSEENGLGYWFRIDREIAKESSFAFTWTIRSRTSPEVVSVLVPRDSTGSTEDEGGQRAEVMQVRLATETGYLLDLAPYVSRE